MSLQAEQPKQASKELDFGPVKMAVNYAGLTQFLAELPEDKFFNQMYKSITGDMVTELWPQIATSDHVARTWLAHALYLYLRSQERLPPVFDGQAAIARLIARAANRAAMPDSPGTAFEREVLGVCGWTEAVVPRALTPLSLEITAKLRTIYRPPGADKDEKGAPKVGPLNAGILETRLLPLLKKVIAEQAAHWRPPPDENLAPEPIELIRTLGEFVQAHLATSLQPYADGRKDGPFFNGFKYADRLQSTWVLPAEQENQVNMLFNRAVLIGWADKYGKLLAEAQFDSNRPGDEELLTDLIKKSLATDDPLRDDVVLLIKHTSAHSPAGGMISVQPVCPSTVWGPRTQWRWRLIRTLAHELLHRLAHPDFTATATDPILNIRNSQIIKEGFVDLLTMDVYTSLIADAKKDPTVAKQLFAGIGQDPGEPDNSFLQIGYGDAGRAAGAIRNVVTNHNVRAAFFLGATHLIGLDRSG